MEVLWTAVVAKAKTSWRDVVLLLPILGGALSALHLIFYALHLVLARKRAAKAKKADIPNLNSNHKTDDGAQEYFASLPYVDQLGGRGVVAFRIVRLVFALALFSAVGLVQLITGLGVRQGEREMIYLGKGIRVRDVEVWGMFGIYVRFLSCSVKSIFTEHLFNLI